MLVDVTTEGVAAPFKSILIVGNLMNQSFPFLIQVIISFTLFNTDKSDLMNLTDLFFYVFSPLLFKILNHSKYSR